MTYNRKTRDVWDVLGDYGFGFEVVTSETSVREARARLREYRAEEPGTPFCMRLNREPINQSAE